MPLRPVIGCDSVKRDVQNLVIARLAGMLVALGHSIHERKCSAPHQVTCVYSFDNH